MANDPAPSNIHTGDYLLFLPPSFYCWFTFIFVDHGDKFSAPPSSVRLPYSCVPNLDISSRAYQKAIATLAKQAHHEKHDLVSCPDTRLPVLMEIGLSYFSPFFVFFN
jgi:hypothetical protein